MSDLVINLMDVFAFRLVNLQGFQKLFVDLWLVCKAVFNMVDVVYRIVHFDLALDLLLDGGLCRMGDLN